MSDRSDTTREGRISNERTTIQGWADEHGAVPVRDREADTPGEYRLASETDVGERHEEAGWDDFFTHLDENDRVVIYHEEGAGEPFEVARRDEAVSRSDLEREEIEERLVEGETVTSTVTETTVVESVVVEEATVESELVESEIVEQRVMDAELLRRECTSCDLVSEGETADEDWFDADRYFESAQRPGATAGAGTTGAGTSTDATADETTAGTAGTAADRTSAEETTTDRSGGGMLSADDYPYYPELEVEENWTVTRELVERFTVESRIADAEASETDTVAEQDIDTEGLQREIAESGMLDVEHSSDEVMTEYDVETEFHEDDRVRTTFDREMVVEDEVVDRRRVRADVSDEELLGMETIRSEQVDAEFTGDEGLAVTGDRDVATAGEGTTATAGETTATAGEFEIDDDQIGKTVVDATGDKIGMVSAVDEDRGLLHVDPHAGITEKIKAALDWGDVADDDYPVGADQIEMVDRDEIRLKEREDLEETSTTDDRMD